MVAPTIVAAIISAVVIVALAVVGFFWRQLRQEREKRQNLETRVNELEGKVQTLKYWAFGNPRDETDDGLVFDVEKGFDGLGKRIDRIEEKVDILVQELHDDEDTDFERDDLSD